MATRLQLQALLASLAFVYLSAFCSLYIQLKALYSSNGILPADALLQNVASSHPEARSFLQQWKSLPTLLWLKDIVGEHTDTILDILALLGIIFSVLSLTLRQCRCKLVFALMWLCYLSIYSVGTTFLGFQWDILLLEAGFLAILAAPTLYLRSESTVDTIEDPDIFLFMFKWLGFRLMYQAGVVKLTSGCPTWWNLTALDIHHQGTCIPNSIAWFAHQLPHWVQAFSVVITFVIEILIPFLFFIPTRFFKLFAFWSQFLLMVIIMLTGSYNFFNFLTIAILISLLDDEAFPKLVQKLAGVEGNTQPSRNVIIDVVLPFIICGGIILFTIAAFGVSLHVDGWNTHVECTIQFSRNDFDAFLFYSINTGVVLGAIGLLYVLLTSLYRSIRAKFVQRLKGGIKSDLGAEISSFSDLFHALVPQLAKQAHEFCGPYAVVNSFGLFRRMTGVDGRDEIQLEGCLKNCNNEKSTSWVELQFLYKPGPVDQPPRTTVPHQPRLDWHMWFAALGTYNHNPWLINFCLMLMEGNQNAYQLIGPSPPFSASSPPQSMRIKRYKYFFTAWKDNTTKWWRREFINYYISPFQYTPALAADIRHQMRIDSAVKMTETKCQETTACRITSGIRDIVDAMTAEEFVGLIVVTVITFLLLGRGLVSS